MLEYRSFPVQRLFGYLREGSWIIVGQVLAVLGMLLDVRILTELLNPSAYGELALAMTLVNAVAYMVTGPISQAASRHYVMAADARDMKGYFGSVATLTGYSSLVVLSVACLIVIVLMLLDVARLAALITVALSLALFSGYNAIANAIQNAGRRRHIVAVHQAGLAWVRVGLAATFIVLIGATSLSAIMGYTAATLLILCSQSIFLRMHALQIPMTKASSEWTGRLLDFAWPIGIWGSFSWLQRASDRWALEIFADTAEVGLYAVLFQLGFYPLSIATQAVIQFVAPIVYMRAGDASDPARNSRVARLIWKLSFAALGISIVMFFLAQVLHSAIFRYLVASDYWSISYLLPWVILSGGLFAAGQVQALQLMSLLSTRKLMPVKIVTAILGVMLNFVGAYFFGMVGIVFAGVLFSGVFFCWNVILSARTTVWR